MTAETMAIIIAETNTVALTRTTHWRKTPTAIPIPMLNCIMVEIGDKVSP